MNHPVAEIFSQGEEVISGQVADTNAAWLSQQLVQIGFVVSRHTAVGDKVDDLIDLLKEISVRADLCICTGGLGPTVDDLTAEAVAKAFGRDLQLDTIALSQIEHFFSKRKKVMAESNRKQAYLPQSAIRIDNDQGSAPGFSIKNNKCWFVFLPGVPTEMREMFIHHLHGQLLERFVLHVDKLFVIKTIGIGESDLQQKLNKYTLPNDVQLGFRASTDEVQTKLLFPAIMANTEINACVNEIVKIIGVPVFAVDDSTKHGLTKNGLNKDDCNNKSTSLVSVIGQLMTEKKYTLSVLETASQGLISAKCIGHDWLLDSSFVQNSDLLIKHHAITNQNDLAETTKTIAYKLKQTLPSDLILVQLYQGKILQLLDQNNSIVIHNALLTPHGTYHNTCTISGSIQRKQNQSAIRALDLLRRVLQNKCH